MNASFKQGQTLGSYQEVMIRSLHNTLDEYLNVQVPENLCAEILKPVRT
jgi:hypothetical protein